MCLGFSTLGAAIDISGRLWTWGSNIAGELGIGDNEPKIHPYPVLSLKKKTVTHIACGSSFVVALGSNLKKELPGLRLNLKKKVSSLSRRHKRNIDDVNSVNGGCGGSAMKQSAQSQDRKSSKSRSNKKSKKQ